MSFSKAESHPCVILASPVYDRYLLNEVVRCGGFDVLPKSASPEQFARTLRFASFWKENAQNYRAAR